MSQTIDLERALKVINHFSAERDWDQFHSVKNLTMALSVECSELVEIYQWMPEEKSNDKTNVSVVAKAEDEVADILIYLLRIADKLDIDLERAMYSKLEKNALKYPIEKSKGNSKKYDEL